MYFLRHARCPKRERDHQIWTMADKEKGKGVKNRTFCWMSFVNDPLCMSRPPAHPRIGVNRGLVGVRIRKHSQEVMKFETIWNLLFPRYGDC